MSSSSTDRDLARSAERYERLLEVQSLMARVSREIGPALDLDQVLTTVLAAMRSLVQFDGGVISLLAGDELVMVATDPAPTGSGTMRTPANTGIAGEVLATGVSATSADLRVDDRITDTFREITVRRGIASYMCVPLICLGDIIGTIQVHATRVDAFDDESRVLLEGLAIQVAGAIESARRYEMITQLEVLKSDFIARVSHELRTPITIMSGFVSTLLTNHDRLDADTRHRMLERVDVATARLSGLIDQLLMLSRLEAGVVAANVEVVDATSVLEEVRRQSERPEAVEVRCAEGLLLTTDPALLIRALGFLVDNALKYAGACRIDAAEGIVEITDEGPGIPSAQRSHVFEQFTRANEDTTVAGMGIGLPMARTLLAAAAADLTIEEPVDGVGTRLVARFW
ncbi:MAG: sensor histidine kinase KdpD [Actinomycetia bacterium]|nr:sensor histidine kinase KdpD [Actinomycetes bacterium]